MTTPLHERIRSGIEARILSGALAPGARLPVEHELMREHGCSRMTVSKALSALAAAGLIERRKRAGSFVARPRMHSMVLDVPDLAVEVAARGQRYRYREIDRGVRPSATPEEARLADGAMLLALGGVHIADDVPLAVERRLVSLAAVPGMDAACGPGDPPGSWLLAHIPWTEAETRIAAIRADAVTAELLAIDEGTACLAIDRRTWRGTERITTVRQIFVGSGYDLTARFRASAAGTGIAAAFPSPAALL